MSEERRGTSLFGREFIERALTLDDEVPAIELLRLAQMQVRLEDWTELTGNVLFHLCVEIVSDLPNSISHIYLHRFSQLLISKEMPPRWRDAALACLSRATNPVHPVIFDRILFGMDADPTTVPHWPCECSSMCCLARKMCEGSTAVDLAIRSYNFSALERILFRRSDASPSSCQAIVPLFRQNKRVTAEVRESTLSVFSACFPESTCPELYAAARLIAILCDGRDGVLEALPVEKVGICGRAARGMLSDLSTEDGDPILFVLAGTPLSKSGRDVLVKFLVDIKVPVTVVNRKGFNILEYAVTTEPSFWVPQNGRGESSPAATIQGYAKELATCRFFRSCAHISTSTGCKCKLCSKWKSAHTQALANLHEFLESVTDGLWVNSMLPGYTLLDMLKGYQPSDLPRISALISKGADLTVTDRAGNTALHLGSEKVIVEQLLSSKANVDALNSAGMTPLDCSLVSGEFEKADILIRSVHASITAHGMERLVAIFESTGDVPRRIKKAIQDVREGSIDSSWSLRIREAEERVEQARTDAKQSIEKALVGKQSQIESMRKRHSQEIRESTDSNTAALRATKDQLTDALAKLAKTEALFNESVRLRTEIETEASDLQRKLRKSVKSKSREAAKREQDRKEFENENESRECSLCMAALWDTALSCGHCYCLDCVESLCKVTCPTCAKKSNGKFIKLFNCRR